MPIRPVCLVVAVGLTRGLLDNPAYSESTPTLRALAASGGVTPLTSAGPGLTLAAQASLLTGKPPREHGVVGNGWHFRDTDEVRFWQQSRNLIDAPLVYETARERARAAGEPFSAANIFGWFNQASRVEFALTPKPWYGCDGSKAFGIHGKPESFVADARRRLGEFPFHAFWGPMAGEASSRWIALATAEVLVSKRPTFTLAYLPHLDYDLQRHGATGPHVPTALGVLDGCVAVVADACHRAGARLVVVSEYGLVDVMHSFAPNRALRDAGLLAIRGGPFGELIDVPDSPAVAVCDHQIAHVTVRDPAQIERVVELFSREHAVGRVLVGEARAELGLDHPRAGDVVLLARRDAWFDYSYWLRRGDAPDFAPTVDIHRKPGYDPLELFTDPKLVSAPLRAGLRLMQKKLGFRYRMDLVPVDQPQLVRGSHGLPPASADEGPLLLCADAELAESMPSALTGVHDWLLAALAPAT